MGRGPGMAGKLDYTIAKPNSPARWSWRGRYQPPAGRRTWGQTSAHMSSWQAWTVTQHALTFLLLCGCPWTEGWSSDTQTFKNSTFYHTFHKTVDKCCFAFACQFLRLRRCLVVCFNTFWLFLNSEWCTLGSLRSFFRFLLSFYFFVDLWRLEKQLVLLYMHFKSKMMLRYWWTVYY